jgi:hypothetical protein
MSVLYDFLMQTAPILLGIAFMLIINALKLGQSKIRIRSQSDAAAEVCSLKPAIEEPDCSRFEREARDRLIENGCMRGDDFKGNVRELAFDRLGIIECGRLNGLADLARQNRPARLNIFTSDRKDLLRSILHFGPDSGVLLSYLEGYRVDVFGA